MVYARNRGHESQTIRGQGNRPGMQNAAYGVSPVLRPVKMRSCAEPMVPLVGESDDVQTVREGVKRVHNAGDRAYFLQFLGILRAVKAHDGPGFGSVAIQLPTGIRCKGFLLGSWDPSEPSGPHIANERLVRGRLIQVGQSKSPGLQGFDKGRQRFQRHPSVHGILLCRWVCLHEYTRHIPNRSEDGSPSPFCLLPSMQYQRNGVIEAGGVRIASI